MQGGSRTSGPGFEEFLQLERSHFHTKMAEFLLPKKRAQAAMLRYRAKQSCWDRTIATLLRAMKKVGYWFQLN